MISVYLTPVYILVNAYICCWLLKCLGTCHHIFHGKVSTVVVAVVYFFVALSMGIGFLLPSGNVRRIICKVGNAWLGLSIFIVSSFLFVMVLRLVIKYTRLKNRPWAQSGFLTILAAVFVITVSLILYIYGVWNAKKIQCTQYEVTVHKSVEGQDELKIILLADLHLGYNIGCGHMRKMVEIVNEENADLVVIAGDIFDNDYEALEDPEELSEILRGIQSRYGVYACYGNHDIREKILAGFTFDKDNTDKMSDPRMDQFVKDCNITLLRDEYVLVNNSFYVYGRPDKEKPGRGITQRKAAGEITNGMDKTKPIIVIDHEPKELQELSDAGVDLDLCGHTHDGQVFPGNIIVDHFWENACGYLQKGQMHNIVTSGVGVFGPNIRVGTKSEICSIKVRFDV
ncbi:MAG: metallophosphoesterase [Muricoprocola sp.]